MPDDIDALLAERQKTHGHFDEHADVTQYMKDLFRWQPNWQKMTPYMRETLDMTAHKIGRIMAGSPFVNDHWDDIAGYNRLTSQLITADRAKSEKKKTKVAVVDNGAVVDVKPKE